MATYDEIEYERRVKTKYVTYNYNKMTNNRPDLPQIPDEFNPEYNWCKYWVGGLGNGLPSRADIYDENMKNHNIYDENGHKYFEEIKKYVKDPEKLEYFRRLTTINLRGDNTCQLMLYGGATINFDALIKDLIVANDAKQTEILHTLTKQVNMAALNGVMSKLYFTVNNISSNPNKGIPNKADKFIEGEVTKLYNSITIGGRRPCANIPEEPNKQFALVENLNRMIDEISIKKNLDQQSIKNIIDTLQTTVNKAISQQQRSK